MSNAPPLEIRTSRMTLLACDLPHYDAMLAGDAQVARVLGIEVEPDWTGGFDAAVLAGRLRAPLAEDPARLPWWARMFVHEGGDRRLIGFGGYKGAPDTEGRVEIGYALAPAWRGQGLAHEAARGLADAAFALPGITAVRAHTLAEENASTAVLRRLGMERVAELEQPGVGAVWRWAVAREAFAGEPQGPPPRLG